MRLKDARLTIVGLGLMGGSLGAGLKRGQSCREIRGVARRPESIAEAVSRQLIDAGTPDLAAGVAGADVVILATPVRSIIELIPRVGPLLSPGCLLMDLGSTKVAITEAMQRFADSSPTPETGVQAIGGHPMCGKEIAGIQAAEPDLYRGATFCLTPLPQTNSQALALACELVEALGARPMVMEAHRHDRLVAVISHLPYLLSLGLVTTAEEFGLEDGAVWDLAASGFRDTSRLAASDVHMMLDILLSNSRMEIEVLGRLRKRLDELDRILQRQDEGALQKMMDAAQQRRRGLFPSPGTVISR